MEAFTVNQWIVLLLVLLLGIVLGMYVFSSPKWKRRYREELRLREELEIENKRLRSEGGERDTLHRAALRNPPADRARGPI